MVIVKLIGGLGNQLFQYATARRLAVHHNADLKFDITPFNDYPKRKYELGELNIPQNFAHYKEIIQINPLKSRGIKNIYIRIVSKIGFRPLLNNVFYEPNVQPYNPNILNTPSDVYLDGYWQSEKYFIDIKNHLLEEITLKQEPSLINLKLLETIQNSQSIGVHIRRGDYIDNPKVREIHGSCSAEYYFNAVNILSADLSQPHCFIFSDDPLWVSENISFPVPTTFVTQNNKNIHEDFWLMSKCMHNIIANSSFSWWAAWINDNPDKKIIAPTRWFSDSSLDSQDVIPDNWIKI